jgi:hypothetical protein
VIKALLSKDGILIVLLIRIKACGLEMLHLKRPMRDGGRSLQLGTVCVVLAHLRIRLRGVPVMVIIGHFYWSGRVVDVELKEQLLLLWVENIFSLGLKSLRTQGEIVAWYAAMVIEVLLEVVSLQTIKEILILLERI